MSLKFCRETVFRCRFSACLTTTFFYVIIYSRMKILLLEDSEERVTWFKAVFSSFDLDATKDPQEAIEWLKTGEYDTAFLDHDLEDVTGLPVAEYIGNNQKKFKGLQIVVHSMDGAARTSMVHAMKGMYVQEVPYSTLQKIFRI